MQDQDQDQPAKTYQDDLDTAPEATDPVMDEETDTPAEELGVPQAAYSEEMNQPTGFSERPDDSREDTEDMDEDGDDDSKGT